MACVQTCLRFSVPTVYPISIGFTASSRWSMCQCLRLAMLPCCPTHAQAARTESTSDVHVIARPNVESSQTPREDGLLVRRLKDKHVGSPLAGNHDVIPRIPVSIRRSAPPGTTRVGTRRCSR